MESIPHDEAKFKVLGPASSNDSTFRLETRLHRQLLKLHKDELLSPKVYKAIRPTGSVCSWMYGLPKTHKKYIPSRSILSMIGSS